MSPFVNNSTCRTKLTCRIQVDTFDLIVFMLLESDASLVFVLWRAEFNLFLDDGEIALERWHTSTNRS